VGRPPFERETREETYNWIAKREPALPSWMSEGAKQFITAALAKVRPWCCWLLAADLLTTLR